MTEAAKTEADKTEADEEDKAIDKKIRDEKYAASCGKISELELIRNILALQFSKKNPSKIAMKMFYVIQQREPEPEPEPDPDDQCLFYQHRYADEEQLKKDKENDQKIDKKIEKINLSYEQKEIEKEEWEIKMLGLLLSKKHPPKHVMYKMEIIYEWLETPDGKECIEKDRLEQEDQFEKREEECALIKEQKKKMHDDELAKLMEKQKKDKMQEEEKYKSVLFLMKERENRHNEEINKLKQKQLDEIKNLFK